VSLQKKGNKMFIAESVTSRHPDKICDIISDAIVDECLKQDKNSRVAIETAGGHGQIYLVGEITTKAELDFDQIAKDEYQRLVGEDINITSTIVKQSPEIKNKVDTGGAGDQGLMIGYACRENDRYMPQEMYYAKKLLEGYEVDGKSQVVMDGSIVKNVVLSVQNEHQMDLEKKVRSLMGSVPMYCNNIGEFTIGGFDGDSGCTGRKIVVDAYGGRVPVGGGAFSGKDPSKVDRSAAYMARWVAVQFIKGGASEALVKLGYVIGKVEPLLQEAIVDGKTISFDWDCRPQSIVERFDLLRPIYKDTAENGHFGRNLIWEI
jgi:S-adenosylmethionine synthetase